MFGFLTQGIWNGLLSTALVWAITKGESVIHTDVLGQPIAPFFKGQDFLAVEVGSNWMSQNVVKKLQLYAT
jgi:hypothetical protein